MRNLGATLSVFAQARMSAKALAWVVLVGAALFSAMLTGLWIAFPPPYNEMARVQYLEQYISVLQIIAIGFVVTLVSTILPLLLPEARDQYDKYKDSRQAYSRAKTAVLYLPDRVASAKSPAEAFAFVQEAHRDLHLAETFGEVIIERGYVDWFGNPGLWLIYNYWQIVAIAEVLRRRAMDWGNPDHHKDMKRRLNDALKVVHDRFGSRGEKCEREDWRLPERGGPSEVKNRFKEEDKIERDITVAVKN